MYPRRNMLREPGAPAYCLSAEHPWSRVIEAIWITPSSRISHVESVKSCGLGWAWSNHALYTIFSISSRSRASDLISTKSCICTHVRLSCPNGECSIVERQRFTLCSIWRVPMVFWSIFFCCFCSLDRRPLCPPKKRFHKLANYCQGCGAQTAGTVWRQENYTKKPTLNVVIIPGCNPTFVFVDRDYTGDNY